MVMEDLLHIITETTQRAPGRRTLWILSSVAVLLVVVLLSLIIGVIYLESARDNENRHNANPSAHALVAMKGASGICVTSKCLKAASLSVDMMNSKVDPCEDFYSYACGGWQAKQEPPPSRRYLKFTNQLSEQNERKWRSLLESSIARDNENSSERKLKDFFQMCLHDYGRMKESGAIILDIIQNHLNGWYALDPDNWHSRWNINDALRIIHSDYDVDALFRYGVWPDSRHYKDNIISVSTCY